MKKKNARAQEIAEYLHTFEEGDWDWEALAELCELAGMAYDYNAHDGATLETVASAAARKLGVSIYKD